MTRLILGPLTALVLFLAAGAAMAQNTCIYPRPPDTVPDGLTATFEQMVEAQKATRQFTSDIESYTACLEMELQSMLANPELSQQDKQRLSSMQAQKNNAAVDHAEQMAERFNEQLRAYNGRSKDKK
jgi:hypothetical protein